MSATPSPAGGARQPACSGSQVHVIDPVTGAILRTHAGTYNNEGLMHTIDIGDADADGYDDYVVRSAQGGVWGYSGLSGQQLFVIGGPTSYGRWMKKVGDWNGDGYEDFAIWNNGSYPFGTYEQTQIRRSAAASTRSFSTKSLRSSASFRA
jgi:hypothetical protein